MDYFDCDGSTDRENPKDSIILNIDLIHLIYRLQKDD
jgi:hypothetical protein